MRVVRVVERRAADGDAADGHRLHHRHRDDDTCQAHFLSAGCTACWGALGRAVDWPWLTSVVQESTVASTEAHSGALTQPSTRSPTPRTNGGYGASSWTQSRGTQHTHHGRRVQGAWGMLRRMHGARAPYNSGALPFRGTRRQWHTRSADGQLHFPQLRDRNLGSRLQCHRPLGVRVIGTKRPLLLQRRSPRSSHILTRPPCSSRAVCKHAAGRLNFESGRHGRCRRLEGTPETDGDDEAVPPLQVLGPHICCTDGRRRQWGDRFGL